MIKQFLICVGFSVLGSVLISVAILGILGSDYILLTFPLSLVWGAYVGIRAIHSGAFDE